VNVFKPNKLSSAICGLLLSGTAGISHAENWVLNSEQSYLKFITIKNDHKVENQTFTGLQASIVDNQARLIIDAETISTNIDLRDERIRTFILETDFLPDIYLQAAIDPAFTEALQEGDTKPYTLDAELQIRGTTKPITSEVLVTKLANDRLNVTSVKPFILDAMAFALDGSIAVLRDIAGLDSITLNIPVDFNLNFTATSNADDAGIIEAIARPQTPQSPTLQTMDNHVIVNWEPVDNNDTYVVQIRTDDKGWFSVAKAAASTGNAVFLREEPGVVDVRVMNVNQLQSSDPTLVITTTLNVPGEELQPAPTLNLLSNAGAEEESLGWVAEGLQNGIATISTDVKRSGEKSFHLIGTGTGRNVRWNSTLIKPASHVRSFTLSGWIKGENAGRKTDIEAYITHTDGTLTYLFLEPGFGSFDWQFLEQTWTVDKEIASIQVRLHADGIEGTQAWFDDISLSLSDSSDVSTGGTTETGTIESGTADTNTSTGDSGSSSGSTGGSEDSTPADSGSSTPSQHEGSELYAQLNCGGCHGAQGESGIPILSALQTDAVVSTITNTMPFGNPGACDTDCSEAIVSWLRTINNISTITPADSVTTPVMPQPDSGETDWLKSLHKMTTSLAWRLPTAAEITEVSNTQGEGLRNIATRIVEEDAFYERLKELYDDTLHLSPKAGAGLSLARRILTDTGGDQFWFETAGYGDKTTDDGKALKAFSDSAIGLEPLELISYITRNDLPFNEILSANYTMVNYYSARAYGLPADSMGFRKDPNAPVSALPYDATDFKPVDLPNYEEAGVLAAPSYLVRYTTTSSNMNRHRARMTFQYFLDVDILSLGGSRTNLAEGAATENPTMTNPACTTCHTVMDPVASSFWKTFNYGSGDALIYTNFKRWNADGILAPGFNGELNPLGYDDPQPLRWLGKQIAQDRRFALATIKTLFRGITGHSYLSKPAGNASESEHLSYEYQQMFINDLADRFIANNWNMKQLVIDLVSSDYFTSADYLGGSSRMLTPEMLYNKIFMTTGYSWDKIWSYETLYGGINHQTTLERITDPNGVMAAIQGRMAADVACQAVPKDFSLDASQRMLFPNLALSTTPNDMSGNAIAGNEATIKQAFVHLHWLLYGETLSADDAVIQDAYDTLSKLHLLGISSSAGSKLHKTCDTDMIYDENYQVRTWMAMMTMMLNDYRFLYD
jgi:hypothetical protein